MPIIYLSLGSNLGRSKGTIKKALTLLEKSHVKILKLSSFYQTEPLEIKNQPWFLNLCLKAKTDLFPHELLIVCQKIEKKLGRKVRSHYAPREIDLDILFYDQKIINKPNLQIPHPKIAQRKFVLIPLNEIASRKIHPVLKKPIKILLSECKDQGIVQTESAN